MSKQLTVKQLIELLSKENPNDLVYRDECHNDYKVEVDGISKDKDGNIIINGG